MGTLGRRQYGALSLSYLKLYPKDVEKNQMIEGKLPVYSNLFHLQMHKTHLLSLVDAE